MRVPVKSWFMYIYFFEQWSSRKYFPLTCKCAGARASMYKVKAQLEVSCNNQNKNYYNNDGMVSA